MMTINQLLCGDSQTDQLYSIAELSALRILIKLLQLLAAVLYYQLFEKSRLHNPASICFESMLILYDTHCLTLAQVFGPPTLSINEVFAT